MLDRDVWLEVLDTMRKNKLRTALTGFSVAWGIFMLILLLGSGHGLANGVEYQFRDDATNSIRLRGTQTSLPHQGLPPGRTIKLTNSDLGELRDRVPGIEHATGRFWPGGELKVVYRNVATTFDVMGVHPDHRLFEKTLIQEGRYLNDIDIQQSRKVAAIGLKVRDELFRREPALGKWISIGGIPFQVVGVFDDAGGEGELERIVIPVSTAQLAFRGEDRLNMLIYLIDADTVEQSEVMARQMRARLAARHRFSPEDKRALAVFNNFEAFERFRSVIVGIRIFVWIIGLGTILAGIVGVSNIMLITVRDRTKEIGIRRALGATPASIVALVLQESILITSLAGVLGLLLGIGLVEVVGRSLPASDFFREPAVELGVAIQATVLLILAGALAGFIPARRAAAIRPIEALRDE